MMRKVDAEGALAVAAGYLADGMSEGFAAKAAGISLATFRRWRERARAGRPLKDYGRCGRPLSCTVDAADAEILRAYVIRANVGRRRVSAAGGCRLAALDADSGLSEALRAEILKPRADPGALPTAILAAVREVSAPAVVGRYRDSRDGTSNGLFLPGYLRCPEDEIHRKFRPMERVSWDDGSVNFLFWVPWERGGDKCSERFGVRLVRGQMLACIDSGSWFCPAWTFIVRDRDSYTGGDVCAALYAAWSAFGVPPATVMEAHCWQADRVLGFMRRGGTELVDASGRPHQKLVERWFGEAWTAHAAFCPDGHIGRFRGEMWKESKEAQACKDGRLDPRKAFPAMVDFFSGLNKAVDAVNAKAVNSGTYGRWLPAERFAAEEPASHRLPAGLERMALPVIEDRKVGRGGMVSVKASNVAGVPWDFAFALKDGHLFDGARVSVAFDPRFPERGADVRLCGRQPKFGPDFLLIDPAAPCMSPAPVIDQSGPDWSLRWWDSREQGRAAKAASKAAVMTVSNAADARGKMLPARVADPSGAAVLSKAAAQAWPERAEETSDLLDLYA